jgi:hypothetical protein
MLRAAENDDMRARVERVKASCDRIQEVLDKDDPDDIFQGLEIDKLMSLMSILHPIACRDGSHVASCQIQLITLLFQINEVSSIERRRIIHFQDSF